MGDRTEETKSVEEESLSEYKEKVKKQNRIKGIALLVVLIVVVILVWYFTRPEDAPKKDYESGIITQDGEPDVLTSSDRMMLEYKNIAISTDGKTVSCYIANALENEYDMYFEILDDKENSLYESDLIPPGGRLEEIVLNKTLESGDNSMTITYHQMEDDHSTEHSHLSANLLIQVR